MTVQKNKLFNLIHKLDNTFVPKRINESEENLPSLKGIDRLRNVISGNKTITFWFDPYNDGNVFDIITVNSEGINVKNKNLDIVNIPWANIKDKTVINYGTGSRVNKIMFSLDDVERNKYPYSEVQVKDNVDTQINEITPKMASVAFSNREKYGERGIMVFNDALTSIFKKYINYDLDFYIRTNPKSSLRHYKLIEVHYISNGNYVQFYFMNEGQSKKFDDVYSENLREVVLEYYIGDDKYRIKNHSHNIYEYNMYMVNFLIKAANIIRTIFYTSYPILDKKTQSIEPDNWVVDEKKTEEAKKSRLTKNDFNIVPFSNNELTFE